MAVTLQSILNRVLTEAAKRRASTIHLTVGAPPMLRLDEELLDVPETEVLTREFMEKLAESILDDAGRQQLSSQKSLSIVKTVADRFRLKMNFFFQKGNIAAEFRLIPSQSPPLINLGLPKAVYGLADRRSGLIVVAGPYGSGRSTTVASFLEEINRSRKEAILTIEQPTEYLHVNKMSLVEQREVGLDAPSFVDALRACQESDIDVLSVGRTSEPGVQQLVLEFAASGRLTFWQSDATSAVHAIESLLIDFSVEDRSRGQLLVSEALLAVLVQRLIPRTGGGHVLAAEVLINNDAISSLIRENRLNQIPTILQSSRAEGMLTLDQSLAALVKSGEVLIDQAIEYAVSPEGLRSMIKR